jgi:uncharacterized membrane protein (Fun14 family)
MATDVKTHTQMAVDGLSNGGVVAVNGDKLTEIRGTRHNQKTNSTKLIIALLSYNNKLRCAIIKKVNKLLR